ncbi:MAG: glycosyltransferase family 4 protein [Anaerolineales bacterium]|nr:glycosyltransferase family 4 protein [Anaerolineales bacterium]
MRIGVISTRLNGTDGVSLEVEKWARVLEGMGHEMYYCAGELGGYAENNSTHIPKLHFANDSIRALSHRAFEGGSSADSDELIGEIYNLADELRAPLRGFIRSNRLELIVVQNALTIPMNLPLGVCLTGLIAELGIKTIAHHHDFFWERERYQTNAIMGLLDTTFPCELPTLRHVTINSIAQKRLCERRNIDSTVIPNVLDFASPPKGMDNFNKDLRKRLGVDKDEYFIVQPTRVIRRKGIEMALELVANLGMENPRLFVTHSATDEGLSYWHWLQHEAKMLKVDLRLIDDLIGAERVQSNGDKIYALWDVYPHADLVTYPSTYEGFGNGLLEAIYFKRLTMVNEYPVFNADIRPLGFEFIMIEGFLGDHTVQETRELLNDPERVKQMTEKNYEIARQHFSYETLSGKLQEVLDSF